MGSSAEGDKLIINHIINLMGGTHSPAEGARRRGPGRPAGGQPGESQRALLEAARELMAEKGLPRVTVREVAERAGLQPSLVSYYFGGKQGLVRAVVADVASRTLARAAAGLAAEGNAEDRLRAMLRAVIGGMAEDAYGPRLAVEQVLFGDAAVIDEFAERFAIPQLALFRELLERGREEGSFREVELMFLLPQIVGGSLFFFIAEPMLRRLFGLERITPEIAERFAEHAASVVLRGIRALPEEKS